jgi:DNA (cytosine-5)-methyltransferase 1
VAAHIIQNNGGEVGHPADRPTSTVCTKVGHQALAASHLAHFRGSGDRPGHRLTEPLVTLTAGGTHLAEIRTFLVKYYKSAIDGQPSDVPVHSMTTKARFGMVEVNIADVPLTEDQRYTAYWVARLIDVYGHPEGRPKEPSRRKGIGSLRYRSLVEKIDELHRPRPSAVGRDGWLAWDIGMRMFTVRERYRAQGVEDDFIIDVKVDGKPITETKQGEMCGNMVPPHTVAAIVRAALPELRQVESVAA